jgi:hypothetical protein
MICRQVTGVLGDNQVIWYPRLLQPADCRPHEREAGVYLHWHRLERPIGTDIRR